MRAVIAVLTVALSAAALFAVTLLAGHVHGGTSAPPPDMGGGVRCTIQRPIAESGAPGDDAGQRLARRIRRFCDAMNGTPPPSPPGLVNAREFCLGMQSRGQLLPGVDCNRVSADQTYHH